MLRYNYIMWSRYVMNLADYRQHFKEDTILREESYDFVELSVRGIENKEDKLTEYSVEWKNNEVEEGGFIYRINTSSVFALKSCSWELDDECEPSDNENEVPPSSNRAKEVLTKKKESQKKGYKNPLIVSFN